MSELEAIQAALQQTARRRRWSRALRGLWRGLLIGGILSVLLAGAYRLFPLPLWTLIAAGVVPFPCMLAGLIFGGWRQPPLPAIARWVDGKEELKERLSTALEVAASSPSPWRELVISDAASHAAQLDARRLAPFNLTKAARWSLAVLVLGAGLGFVPEYRSQNYLNKKAERQNIKDAGRQLADLTRRNLEKRPPVLEPTQKALESVAELGDKLARVTPARSEALKDLANAAEKLRDELKEFGNQPFLRKLEQAAQSGASASQRNEMEALQKQLGNTSAAANPAALERIQNDLEKVQAAAKAMADNPSSAGQVDRQKLAAALSSASQQLQDMGLQLPQLDEAIQALAASQTEMFVKDLQAAMTDLEKMRDMAQTLQQMQQQAEKLGKDLAEQLQNGQVDAARSTLGKMIQQLRSAALPEEALRKILEEVAKAVGPAGNYGKVAQHLKNAKGNMESGNKSSAATELAAAAKELDNLMQQLGDAQCLKAELDALAQASKCIGSGQGWNACKKPGFKPGGKPGSGVGTWADDEDAAGPSELSAGWDNSGIERPDLDPRGRTRRDQQDLADVLKPTKVKGQLSPGSPMPSITLKGVSVRGQSTVEYEAAATAAQGDAESALTQDKVPRAYQGAVKDYFDDLKK